MTWLNPNVQLVTPIASLGSIAGAPAGTITAGAPLAITTLFNVSQFESYDINMYGYASGPGAVGGVLCYLVTLQWFDDLVSGIPVFEEDWYPFAGRVMAGGANNTLAASGPMHGQYMTITVSVPAAATTGMVLQYVNVFGSPRAVPYSDWRQNAAQVSPEFSGLTGIGGGAGGLGFDNILADTGTVALAVSTGYAVPLNLYAGPVYYYFAQTATASVPTCIVMSAALVGGQLINGPGSKGVLLAIPAAATGVIEGELILPRSGCVLTLGTTSAGNSISFQMSAQQAA